MIPKKLRIFLGKKLTLKKQVGKKTNIYETMNNNKKLNENNNSKFYTKLPSLQM